MHLKKCLLRYCFSCQRTSLWSSGPGIGIVSVLCADLWREGKEKEEIGENIGKSEGKVAAVSDLACHSGARCYFHSISWENIY